MRRAYREPLSTWVRALAAMALLAGLAGCGGSSQDGSASPEDVEIALYVAIQNDDPRIVRTGSIDTASLRRLLTAVPAAEHLKTFQWVFSEKGGDSVVNRYVLGLLQESAGERAAALQTMQALRREPSLSPRIRTGVAAALKRLGRAPPPPARDSARPR